MDRQARQPGHPSQTRMKAAQYLGEMAAECARIARVNRLDALGFIFGMAWFDMAWLEAANVTDERGRPERRSIS